MAEAINRDELQTLAHNGAQVVEVLGAKEYEHAHIAGAINLPLAKLNRETASALIRDRMVILYCYDYQ
ncbi:MAG TPA: rhodanese-like domain-containing protein [Candidatus Binatia bacterium]